MSDHTSQPDPGGPLHFGCGFILGGALLSLLALRSFAHPTYSIWIGVAIGAVILGFLARRYAGDFWDDFLKLFDVF